MSQQCGLVVESFDGSEMFGLEPVRLNCIGHTVAETREPEYALVKCRLYWLLALSLVRRHAQPPFGRTRINQVLISSAVPKHSPNNYWPSARMHNFRIFQR